MRAARATVRRTALAATLCATGFAGSTAHAQSSVTLYGLIDASLLYTNNAQGHASIQAGSGTVTGSHWGLLGREDLGGGYQAIFEIENGFSIMNGSLRQGGREFGYQSYAGLANNRYGTVTLGRQYDSVVDYLAPLSFTGQHPGGNNLTAHPYDNDNLNNSFRVNNAVKFASVPYGGLKFGALYAFSDEAGGFEDNRLYSAGASCDMGPLSFAAGYLQANSPGSSNTNGALTLSDRTFVAALQRIYGAGVNYAIGAARLGFVWTRTQLGGLSTINGANSLGLGQNGQGASFDNFEVNASYLVTPSVALNGAYTYTGGTLSTATGEHRPRWHDVSVQADYFLSKRTDVYVQASYQHIAADGSGLTAISAGNRCPAATSRSSWRRDCGTGSERRACASERRQYRAGFDGTADQRFHAAPFVARERQAWRAYRFGSKPDHGFRELDVLHELVRDVERKQRRKPAVDRASLLQPAGFQQSEDRHRFLRERAHESGHPAVRAHQEGLHREVVDATEKRIALADRIDEIGDAAHVAGRLLDRHELLFVGEFGKHLGRHVDAVRQRIVVDHDRQRTCACNHAEVVQGFAAIGKIAQARQHHVTRSAARGAPLGLAAAVERAVFRDREEDGNAPLCGLHGDVEHLQLFVERKRGRFAQRSADDDAVHAGGNLRLDVLLRPGAVYAEIGVELGGDCGQDAFPDMRHGDSPDNERMGGV
jgi:GBP family porin